MKMMKSLPGPILLLLLFLLGSTVCVLGSVLQKRFHHLKAPKTWHAARNHCRGSFTDLVSISGPSEADRLPLDDYNAWFGAYRSADNGWLWSGEENYHWWNWAYSEPHDGKDCAYVSYKTKQYYSSCCFERFFFFCSDANGPVQFHFVQHPKRWKEAQEYCRNASSDLAAIGSSGQRDSMLTQQDFYAWTGLHRDGPGEDWKWSGGTGSSYRDWTPGQPGDAGDCVSVSSQTKQMVNKDCDVLLPYVCYHENLLLVKENKTWEEALEHCRAIAVNPNMLLSDYRNHLYDLVSLQTDDDHRQAREKIHQALTDQVWTGLRLLAGQWVWVNGEQVRYDDLPLCPARGQRCGTLPKNGTRWEVNDCTERRNFLCYKKG